MIKQDSDEQVTTHRGCNKVCSIAMSITNRILILFTGVSTGFIFFIPAGMASDSGTTLAITFSYIGLTACVLFVIGGIIGAIRNRWYYLRPGLIVLTIFFLPALIVSLYTTMFGESEQEDYSYMYFDESEQPIERIVRDGNRYLRKI